MLTSKSLISRKTSEGGLTLVELLVVLAILGILVAIAVPSIIGLIEKLKKDVCEANRLELERMYLEYLKLESKEHSVIHFQECFLGYDHEICPSGGVISYEEGAVNCSIHNETDGDVDDPNNGNSGVPFLCKKVIFDEVGGY